MDSAWIEDDGRLIAEWYEWRGDDDRGAPYDHADTITFDTDGKSVLAKAMDIPAGDDRLLAEIQNDSEAYSRCGSSRKRTASRSRRKSISCPS